MLETIPQGVLGHCQEPPENVLTPVAKIESPGVAVPVTARITPNTTGAMAEPNAGGSTKNGHAKSKPETGHANSATPSAQEAQKKPTT